MCVCVDLWVGEWVVGNIRCLIIIMMVFGGWWLLMMIGYWCWWWRELIGVMGVGGYMWVFGGWWLLVFNYN